MQPPCLGPRQLVYENRFQRVYRVDADFGSFVKDYYVTDTGERAGIVAVRNGAVLLVRQYRLIIDGLSWEIPGGKIDEGEQPREAAVRECLEETGVRCLDPRPLVFYHAGLDARHNPTHIFYSHDTADGLELHRVDSREVTESTWVPLANCVDMIFKGDIVDSFSIVGLLAYQTALSSGLFLDGKCSHVRSPVGGPPTMNRGFGGLPPCGEQPIR